ncbi:hypothetical protein CsatA_023953 [Cannabis sativa]
MRGSIACNSTRFLRHFPLLFSSPTTAPTARSSFASFASRSNPSGGSGRDMEIKSDRERSRGRGGGGGRGRSGGSGSGSGKDKIDALGRLMTRILRHMSSELNLSMRSDGFVKVNDILQLNMKTFAHIPLRSHTVDDVREFNRQVCVHGTYRKNLESILQSGLNRMKRLHIHFSRGLPTEGKVISGMRRNVEVLIYLDVKKALKEGMKLYISDNKVILSEGIDGVIPVKYFEKIESWPDRQPIPF